MKSAGKNWEAWFCANWYVAVMIGFWLIFLGYGYLWLNSHYWEGSISRGTFYAETPLFISGVALFFGVGLLIAAAVRTIPVVKGMMCGFASCLAGGGFWYMFVLYVTSV